MTPNGYIFRRYFQVTDLMRAVANKSGLDFDADFKGIGSGFNFLDNNRTMYEYILMNQNASQLGDNSCNG